MDPGNSGVSYTLNGTSSCEEEGSASDTDSSGSIYSMVSEEIESHFVGRHNRQFHAGSSTAFRQYSFPVDDLEGQRLNSMHNLVKEILGGRNYIGPIRQTLAAQSTGGRRVRVLDICTGNGKWVEEMANEFPRAKVYGLDMVPLVTRYPADNVQFEIHDINTRTRWVPGRFDFVHMRQVCLSPIDYPSVLREVARILRPGGLFLACEWLPGIFRASSAREPQISNRAADFFRHLRDSATERQLFCNPSHISRMLSESMFYEDIVAQQHAVALDNTSRGLLAKESLLDFGNAAQYFLLESGLSEPRVQDILWDLRRDLDDTSGLCLLYFAVHARRKRAV